MLLLAQDAYRLYSYHTLKFLGISRVVLDIVFLLLYAIKSRFAWHTAVVTPAVILVVFLFLYFTGGDVRRPHQHAREVMIIWAVGEAICLVAFLVYLFRVRQPYLRYVSGSVTSTI